MTRNGDSKGAQEGKKERKEKQGGEKVHGRNRNANGDGEEGSSIHRQGGEAGQRVGRTEEWRIGATARNLDPCSAAAGRDLMALLHSPTCRLPLEGSLFCLVDSGIPPFVG